MTGISIIRSARATFAAAVVAAAFSASALAGEKTEKATEPQTDNLPVESVSFNGYSCDMVRAKVAETGVTAAYAYALSMGLSRRDIARVRKACSV